MSPAYEGLPHLLVSDGIINAKELAVAGLSTEWLLGRLADYDIHDVEKVFVAMVDSAGKFYVQEKTNQKRGKQ